MENNKLFHRVTDNCNIRSSYKAKNYLYCPLSCTLRAHERWLYESGRADCACFLVVLPKSFW